MGFFRRKSKDQTSSKGGAPKRDSKKDLPSPPALATAPTDTKPMAIAQSEPMSHPAALPTNPMPAPSKMSRGKSLGRQKDAPREEIFGFPFDTSVINLQSFWDCSACKELANN